MPRKPPSIWWWAFGYFACYVPYSALINALTYLGIHRQVVPGVVILPSTVMATVLAAVTFLVATGWWRYAVKPGRRFPTPTAATVASGLCASGIIVTTSYAYTFQHIVLMVVLMKAGVLIFAPIIDVISGRRIRWYSASALALAIGAVALPLRDGVGNTETAAVVTVAIYLACYFVRLQLMTRRAKSSDEDANLRYFVEEQLVSSPALLIGLLVFAFVGGGDFAGGLHLGFTDFWSAMPIWFVGLALLAGVLSQGTGIFGGLVLLDKSENTFSVPVNRASSVFAVLASSFALEWFADAKPPGDGEIEGAALMVVAIVILSVGSLRAKRN